VLTDHATASTTLSPSPRRQRATTTLAKPRTSAERIPEEDASWWTEEIHKRREIRRRMREVEDENTVIIGNKVDSNHPNYVTAYNMLTGLRVAVNNKFVWWGTDL
jgi:1-phosphatidylinositol-4-phosphate 5-kinase